MLITVIQCVTVIVLVQFTDLCYDFVSIVEGLYDF